MDTPSLLLAFGPPLTSKAPALKLIVSDEFNISMHIVSQNVTTHKRYQLYHHKCINKKKHFSTTLGNHQVPQRKSNPGETKTLCGTRQMLYLVVL